MSESLPSPVEILEEVCSLANDLIGDRNGSAVMLLGRLEIAAEVIAAHKPQSELHGAMKVGARVYWTDPDCGIASGPGTITGPLHEPVGKETIISLRMDDGGEVEALVHELRLL